VEADHKVASPLKALYFTLFESDCEMLRDLTEQYRFGSWVVFDPKIHEFNRPTVVTELKEV
jgi:hypothetical protein